MMRALEKIKDLIRQDRIDEAIVALSMLDSAKNSDSLTMLTNRYAKWKKEKRMGLGDNPTERNSIVYGLLETMNGLEDSPAVKSQADKEVKTTASGKLEVFISYSHKDTKSLAELKRHFAPLNDKVNFWDDSKIAPGQKWFDEISKQLQKSKIAILLISADFFNSDFIKKNELPPLLKAAEDAGVQILSIILKPCLWEAYPEINQYQTVNDPAEPISLMNKNKRELVWVKLVKHIKDYIEQKGNE